MTIAPKNSLGKKKDLRLMTFLIGLLTAAAFFVPFIISGDGYFIFFGDFNVQQIPFYQHCHEMVRSGDFYGWDWQTDLGANFIGSYSFYLLGSPFFWLTLPFPNSWVPYLMGPLLILKFACASLTAYMYIRRFTARAESAMAGGLMYAFSGFSVYNIFFNHFHEAIIVFPLLLLALEKFMAERSRGWLVFAVFFSALTNYFFFFGMVVFVIIYWCVRMLSRSFKFKFTEFLLMLFECVLGLLLAAGILLPTVLEVIQNDRLSSVMSGWSSVLYGKEQIFLNVIECFFFPPDLPARPVFFPGAEVKWSSLGGWLPLFGMTGTIAWLQSPKKGTWIRRVLGISVFMALVPGLNAVFSMLNTAYYARWFFMPILVMCLATSMALEDTEVNWTSAWRWSGGITLAFVLVIGFLPTVNDAGDITKWGLYTDAKTNPFKYIYQVLCHAVDGTTVVEGGYYDLRFWVTCAIALFSVLAVRALLPTIKEKRSSVFKPIIALICVVSVLYSAFFISCGQSHSYEMDAVMTDALIEGEVSIEKDPDGNFSRVDVYDGVDNTGLYLNLSSINYFHSIVPASVVDFYSYINVPRSVASRPESKYHAIRPLLSVKYVLDPEIENSKEFTDSKGETAMPNYKFYSNECGYDIYYNENYIPMGFTYDYYVDHETMQNYSDERLAHMMLKGLFVTNDDIPEISKYLKNINTEYNIDENSEGKKFVSFTYDALVTDCNDRREVSAHSFKTTSDGFVANISMDRDNLVFFSVPYHDGWTAKVNGKDAEIYRVNAGFMAVVAPEGACEIVFEFETPGLRIGLIIMLGTIVIIAIYLGIVAIKRSMRPTTPPEYPEGDVIALHVSRYEEANRSAENDENDHLLDNIDHTNINAYVGFKSGFTINDNAVDDFKTGELPDVNSVDEFGLGDFDLTKPVETEPKKSKKVFIIESDENDDNKNETSDDDENDTDD
ncbi:MAG: YfhO family protein [Clostridia bacterium]|nr:YfhO family protein [Clostridia bacterium]